MFGLFNVFFIVIRYFLILVFIFFVEVLIIVFGLFLGLCDFENNLSVVVKILVEKMEVSVRKCLIIVRNILSELNK